MDREALKRIQDFVKRQNRQKKDELPSKTIDEMIEDAKKLDEKRARARKTKTKQEIASEELEYMQREFDNAPVEVTEEENKLFIIQLNTILINYGMFHLGRKQNILIQLFLTN